MPSWEALAAKDPTTGSIGSLFGVTFTTFLGELGDDFAIFAVKSSNRKGREEMPRRTQRRTR
jgi:hypothetical protein